MPVFISAMAASARKGERRRFSTRRAEESGGGGAPFKDTVRATESPDQTAVYQYLKYRISNKLEFHRLFSGEHYNTYQFVYVDVDT